MSNDQHSDLPPRPSLSIPFPLEIGEFQIGASTDLPQTSQKPDQTRPNTDRTPPGRAEDERRG